MDILYITAIISFSLILITKLICECIALSFEATYGSETKEEEGK